MALVEVQSDLAHLYFTKPGKRLNNGNEVPKRLVKEIFGQYCARIKQQADLARSQRLPAPCHAVISAYARKVYDLGPQWAVRANEGDGFKNSYLETKRSLFNALEVVGQRKKYKAAIDQLEALCSPENNEPTAPVGPAGFAEERQSEPTDILTSAAPDQAPIGQS